MLAAEKLKTVTSKLRTWTWKESLNKVLSVRFEKLESPAGVNEGDGWTAGHARRFLDQHGLKADTMTEGPSAYFFEQRKLHRFGSLQPIKTISDKLPRGVYFTVLIEE